MFLHSSCHPKLLNSSTGVFIDTLMKSVVKESTSSRIPLESPDLLAWLACSTACGTASGRGLGGSVVGCPTGTMNVRKQFPGLMRISRILVTFSSLRWGYISTCCVFRSHSLQHILRSVIKSSVEVCKQYSFWFMFSIFSNWVKHIFFSANLSIGEIWIAGTMAFEGLVRVHGHGTRCCPSRGRRGWESSSIKKKGEGKGGNLLGKSENPAETCLISLFCDTFFIAGVLLGQSQLQWLQVFLGIWQHFDVAAHLAGPNKLKKWLAWFLKIHGFQEFVVPSPKNGYLLTLRAGTMTTSLLDQELEADLALAITSVQGCFFFVLQSERGHVEDWWPGLESKCGCNNWLH